ncbi:MAG: rod shape-determining protein MreC [Defluviitaleaceae bacterium]|nr:rod shape-determining protein MreC [Defluviitaleaceae bacterium]
MDFLQKHKKFFIIGLAGLSFIMMAFTGRGGYQQGAMRSSVGFVLSHGQAFFAGIGNWFADRWDFLTTMNDLHAENTRLQDENNQMQMELDRMLHLANENRMLAEMLDLHLHYDNYTTMGANIIAHDTTNWYNNFTIDRGRNDGITVNMAVLAPGGLAGRISAVGFNYAVVTPLFEHTSFVAGQGLRTGDWGMVQGDINLSSQGLLRMNYLGADADLIVGDYIITSSVSSIFPPGIRIGQITDIRQGSGGWRYATIQPAVDFGNLSAVLIITDNFEFIFESEND